MLVSLVREQYADWQTIRRLVIFSGMLFLIMAFSAIVYQALMLSLSLSLFFGYLLAPLVDKLSAKRPENRPFYCLAIILMLLGFIGIVIAALIPQIYDQLMEISKVFPSAVDYIVERLEPVRRFVLSTGFVESATIDSALGDFNLVDQAATQARGFMEKLWASTPSLFGRVLNFALIPVLLFFLLNDLPRLRSGAQMITPPDLRKPMADFRDKIDLTLRSVLKGQLLVALTLACLYMFGLSVAGISGGLAIGAIAGICRIVPYLDVVVGMFLSLVVIITQHGGVSELIAVCAVFLVVQVLDGMVITPRIIGERAGLHPGVVIASVISFGDWFGFVGILVAVPVVAVIKVVIQASLPYYRLSRFYHQPAIAPSREQ